MRFPGFIGPSYQLSSINVDCQRLINLYPEINEVGTGKEQEVAAFHGTPGYSLFADLGSGPIRGQHYSSNGALYVVSNNKIYKISSLGASTEIGTLNSSAGFVSLADNGIQLVIVDGPDGYVVTLLTDVFAEITDPDWMGATKVSYIDGYFLFQKPDSGQFYISQLNGTDVDALDIAESEGSPDNIVSTAAMQRDFWVLGFDSIEVFQDTGNADFPFERVPGAFIEKGCAAAFSVQVMDNKLYWLGQDKSGKGIVFVAQGYQPQRISTHAIEHAITRYGDISDAVGWSYQEAGHYFYVLNFPTAETSWCFDATTRQWHERQFNNAGALERHRANHHSFAYSKHIIGDYQTGKLYELSNDVYADNTVEIFRRRITPHISSDGNRVFYPSLQLDIETGVGLDGIAQGTDPQAMLRWSDDGGHTWSNEYWQPIGKIGQTKARAIWRRLGSARDRVFEVTITDPVKNAWIGADIGLERGAS